MSLPYKLVQAACVHCHATKSPLLMALFSLSFFFRPVTFLPEGFIIGFRNFAWGSKLIKKSAFVGPLWPPVCRFLVFFLKKNKQKKLRIAWNGGNLTSQTLAQKNLLVSIGGWEEGLACADPGARTPTGASGNTRLLLYFIFKCNILMKIDLD
jgi:hypothetical protein